MLAIIKQLAPVIERKSMRGAGACQHDILTTEQFSLLDMAIRHLLAHRAQREASAKKD